MKKLFVLLALFFSLGAKAQFTPKEDTISNNKEISHGWGYRTEITKIVIKEDPNAFPPEKIAELRKKDRKTILTAICLFVTGTVAIMLSASK